VNSGKPDHSSGTQELPEVKMSSGSSLQNKRLFLAAKFIRSLGNKEQLSHHLGIIQ
jgi:hypothetical protein